MNTSGPPVVVYMSMQDWSKDSRTASLQAYFFLLTVVQLISLYLAGLLSMELAGSNLKLLPAIVVGVWLGKKVYGRLSPQYFQKILLVAIFISGCIFLLKNLPA